MFKNTRVLPPLFLVFVLVGFYLRTIAPGLTWANQGGDGGDFISAIATAGVPHPTGYPSYLFFAGFFQYIPWGSLAFRLNLFSAMSAICASLTVYYILAEHPGSPIDYHRRFAGVLAGLYFGLSPLVWGQAVITEVYTFQAFLLTMLVSVCLFEEGLQTSFARGVLLGLAMGTHLTSILMLPLVFGAGKQIKKGILLAGLLGGMLFGLCVYIVLPWRASALPAINWGGAHRWDGFWWLVTGQLYQGRLFDITFYQLGQRLLELLQFFLLQFEVIGLGFAIYALLFGFRKQRFFFLTVGMALFFCLFSLVYLAFDSYVYLIPVNISFSLWIGIGIEKALQLLDKYPPIYRRTLMLFCLVSCLLFSFFRLEQVDASQDYRAEAYGLQLMRDLPVNAFVFMDGDRSIFTLWYYHFGLKQRPDLVLVATNLLYFDWYREVLHQAYPGIHWPTGVTWPTAILEKNPSHPVCYVSYYVSAQTNCSMIP